jgi:DNA invertase Pin-like site-specific DNA recombinase
MSKAKQGNPLRVIGYVRVSTDEQTLGPEAQRAAIKKRCKAEGLELIQVFQDIGVSGGAELDKRPGMCSALEALRENDAGILMIAKRDRLARDIVIAAMIERLAERAGAKIQTSDGVGEGHTPEAQLMRGIVDVFAQYERAVIRTRTRTALAVKRARRERVGSVPYGYKLAKDGVHLIADPDEQKTVRRAKDLRAEGLTLRAIAGRLLEEGIFPRTGRPVWHPPLVNSLLRAEVSV